MRNGDTRRSRFGIIVKIAKGSKLERKGSGKLCSKSVASMAQFFDQLSINIVICHSSESRETERERERALGCSINHHWFKTSPWKKCDVPPIKFDLPYRGRAAAYSPRWLIVCLIFILERRQKNYGPPVGSRRRLGTSMDQFLKPRHENLRVKGRRREQWRCWCQTVGRKLSLRAIIN